MNSTGNVTHKHPIKRIISCLSINVFFPLLAYLIGLIIKFIYLGTLSFDLLDPTETSFSFAMYLLLCIIGVKNLKDVKLSQSLFVPYFTAFVFLLVMFVLSIIFKTQKENEIATVINCYSGASDITSDLLLNPQLDRTRIITFIISIPAIIASEITRSKYKIEV